ncbi:MAG: hypothetical protein Sylvanvirus24_12 [Sylvanvirus sp.]|uniref:Uncharacterized protein n=1 Tax=Sylvanvirus sp. TaxID=2487774 RepID=A0A3G5AIS7_9VIRU|nr:MAG: hypothetical protein Sylvanvirus24_12 [Sylvanvirus sp.]
MTFDHCARFPNCALECPCGCNNCKQPSNWSYARENGRYADDGQIHRDHYLCFTCRRGWKSGLRNTIPMPKGRLTMSRQDVPDHNWNEDRITRQEEKELEILKLKLTGVSRCSQCAHPGTKVGPDCRWPKASDIKGWLALQHLVDIGTLFQSCHQDCQPNHSRNRIQYVTFMGHPTPVLSHRITVS